MFNVPRRVCVFPAIFRGALDVRAKMITDEMCIASAKAPAKYAEDKGLTESYIIPSIDEWEIYPPGNGNGGEGDGAGHHQEEDEPEGGPRRRRGDHQENLGYRKDADGSGLHRSSTAGAQVAHFFSFSLLIAIRSPPTRVIAVSGYQ